MSLDVIRRRKRRPVSFEDLSSEDGPTFDPADPGPGPDEGMRLEWSDERFEALIAELPEYYRAIVHLRYREEMRNNFV